MSKTCRQCGNYGDDASRPLLEAGGQKVTGPESPADKESVSRSNITLDNETLQNKNYESIA